VAEGTISPGDSASPPVRCAECHELVLADRVRHREEHIKVVSAPRPGRWRAGGPPIFRPSKHSQRFAPGLRCSGQSTPPPRNAYAIERVPVCVDCLRRQRIGLYGVCSIAAACLAVALAFYWGEDGPPSTQQVALPALAGAPKAASGTAATSTPAPAVAAASTAPPPAGDETSGSLPIWRPIRDAAANLLASLPAIPSSTPAAPEPETIVVASAPSPSAENDTSDSPPIWQPIRDATADLLASLPAIPS
jgi:hypothetical protein